MSASAMMNKPDAPPEKRETVVIKKYANRRLYNTETSTYVTLEDLAAMVRSDRDFIVYDAKSGDDLTHSVLTQIIVEQESRAGQTLLPVPFLRQLIRFYGDTMAKMVPSYLQFSMDHLAKEQERFRAQFAPLFQQNPFGAAAFDAMQEQTRKNVAMFEQAMAMWSPFIAAARADAARKAGESAPSSTSDTTNGAAPSAEASELAELKSELVRMQAKIERLSQMKKD
jgi:polyhydroxyalkanoate synthesis repressor PhaR